RLGGEPEEVQRPLDVHLVRRLGDELRPGREERRQVEHGVDLELALEPREQVPVEDVPDRDRGAPAREVRVYLPEVEGQEGVGAGVREVVDEAVTDLAV